MCMAHLRKTRIGWENEHLARYLLSRISFLSSPIFVADDVGVDLLCTLFMPREVNKTLQLFPRQAFAIQLKSKLEEVEVNVANSALPTLEIPFFLGVTDRENSSLAIYSGEMLPDFLSSVQCHDRFILAPQEHAIDHRPDWRWPQNQAGTYKLPMPPIFRITVGENNSDVDDKGEILRRCCEDVLKNIATKTSHEYVFRYGTFARILAGPGSVMHFRMNFMLRLAEAFYNLSYIFKNHPSDFRREEFAALEKTFQRCSELGFPGKEVVKTVYEDLSRALQS